VYKSWPYLCDELAHAVRCRSAVLDGEIACLESDGRSHFYKLMFRREWPYFIAFDLLWLDGKDLRNFPLHRRKRRLTGIMPKVESRVRLVEHVTGRGVDLFRAACEYDLEGVVAKWRSGTYQSGARTSWLKIRNSQYSQWDGRRDLFDTRSDNATRRQRWVRPTLSLV
jgi:bifunctional non-homologous end joining protein LigD